ncbi:MAG: hypothetical protein R6W48_00520 [Gaiellaceae bacterium]
MPIWFDVASGRACRKDGAAPRDGEAGYALFELLVVLSILGLVMVGLTTAFAAGLGSEAGAMRRATAQENTRMALSRMRTDIHCASAAPAPEANPYGGFTLTLTQSPNACPSVTTTSSGVQWCTIPYPGSTIRWQLFRFLGTLLADCGGSAASTLLVDYVAEPLGGWPAHAGTTPEPGTWVGNLWPTAPSCPTGSLPTVAVTISMNVDPLNRPNERYQLGDTIALRNALRCP